MRHLHCVLGIITSKVFSWLLVLISFVNFALASTLCTLVTRFVANEGLWAQNSLRLVFLIVQSFIAQVVRGALFTLSLSGAAHCALDGILYLLAEVPDGTCSFFS